MLFRICRDLDLELKRNLAGVRMSLGGVRKSMEGVRRNLGRSQERNQELIEEWEAIPIIISQILKFRAIMVERKRMRTKDRIIPEDPVKKVLNQLRNR